MSDEKNKSEVDEYKPISELKGEIYALKGVIAVLISHIALSHRSPIERREEIIRSINSILPSALSQLEQVAPPAASAGFENTVEVISKMARTVVRIERVARKPSD